MPFKSKAQRRWMFAAEDRGEVGPGTARRWQRETERQKKRLPERKTRGRREKTAFASTSLVRVGDRGRITVGIQQGLGADVSLFRDAKINPVVGIGVMGPYAGIRLARNDTPPFRLTTNPAGVPRAELEKVSAFEAGVRSAMTKTALVATGKPAGKRQPTPAERKEFIAAHGPKTGVSLGVDDGGFFVYTHRARSPGYPSPSKIPGRKIKFIESTG